MPKLRSAVLLAFGLLTACGTAETERGRLARRFDATGVTRVVLRAEAAGTATAEPIAGADAVTVSGQATGGAAGYHPADPRWRETPAAEWGLDFVARRFGSTLVISTRNEIAFIHHHYTVAGIDLLLPPSVELVRQARVLSGSGEPDLAPP